MKITFEDSREWIKNNVPYGGSIFVSLPMKDKTEEEILSKMKTIHETFMNVFDRDDVSLIDSYHKLHLDDRIPANRKSVWYLGDSIKQMSSASIVIFAEDYGTAKGCIQEHRVCMEYDLPYCFESMLNLINKGD